MMKALKNVLKSIATIFLVLLVTLCIYTFIATDIMKKDYVNVFGYTYFVVATGSMSGTIEVDDIIFVKLTDKVKENDIISFKNSDGDIITHRLINISGDNYITRGDVNNTSDDPINKDQIIGKVNLIISPSFILKSIAIFLILFIFLALINFDKIFQKFIVKEQYEKHKLPDDLFTDPNKKEEPSSGLTQTISLEEMEKINKAQENEEKAEDEIEVLDYCEILEDDLPKKNKKVDKDKETIDLIVSILKCKKNNVSKTKMNKKWLIKYQYVYKLCQIVIHGNSEALVEEINNPPFKEIYDYDLNKVGLTEIIRNRVYDMPIYIFLRILTYCILYNDDEMFDGVYKILKYKIMVDKYDYFKVIKKSDDYGLKQIKTLITYMKRISNKFDNKNVFELEKIEKMVKISNY